MGLVPLNRADHASLRLVGRETMEFTETAHIATLATAEFADAAPAYPIVFADNNGRPGPCALLGLDQGRNQYLMPNGHWLPGVYVPACIRMYPFLPMDSGDGTMDIYIYEDFEGWSTTEGDPLFEADGSDTPELARTMDFLARGVAAMARTGDFVDTLMDLGLLRRDRMQVTHSDGTVRVLDDFWAVDEERLRTLDLAGLARLHDNDYLSLIHAHLFSLHHMKRLVAELADG
ncbi:SapC family protein [Streptomyces purpureus]|uniref:SapC family protein n=1 Tax=Streptomyces purpureus TaxID=1951 RepID=UPI0005930D78|nr:SapC family protein [Streptomyces purpureus]